MYAPHWSVLTYANGVYLTHTHVITDNQRPVSECLHSNESPHGFHSHSYHVYIRSYRTYHVSGI